MAIYKLGDFAFVTKLSGFEYTKYFSNKTTKGEVPLIQSNNIKNNVISYENIYYTSREVSKKLIRSKPIANDVLLSYVGTIGENYLVKNNDDIHLGSNVAIIRVDKNVVDPKYFQLWLNSKNFIREANKFIKGAVQQNISMTDLRKFSILIPSIEEQQLIIDIIKPIELSINCLKLQKENIEKILEKLPINTTDKYIIFDSIKTGRRNANHENNDGKYNFYTCGEKIRKCEEFSFNGRYILLSGNANLYSWWYNGKFDLYQRVYALSPSSDFFTSYHSVKKEMQKLRNESSGSVIKYIKIGDIEHIKKLNNNFEKILETLYNALSKTDSLIELMENLRKNQLELLIK